MIKVRDVIAAEEALEAAEEEFRKFNNDPRQWSAFESMDKRGKKVLNIQPGHFEHREAMLAGVEAARAQLIAVKRGFLEGVIDHAEV